METALGTLLFQPPGGVGGALGAPGGSLDGSGSWNLFGMLRRILCHCSPLTGTCGEPQNPHCFFFPASPHPSKHILSKKGWSSKPQESGTKKNS